MSCAARCPTPGGHASYGACLRAKGIQIDKHALKHGDVDRQKDKTLNRYVSLREQGIHPQSPTKRHVDAAEIISNHTGVAYGADRE